MVSHLPVSLSSVEPTLRSSSGENLFPYQYYACQKEYQKSRECKEYGLRNFRAHLLGTDNREQSSAQKKAAAKIDQPVVSDETQQCSSRGFVYLQHLLIQ